MPPYNPWPRDIVNAFDQSGPMKPRDTQPDEREEYDNVSTAYALKDLVRSWLNDGLITKSDYNSAVELIDRID